MADKPLRPITASEQRLRLRRIRSFAARLGFSGRVEYRHVTSNTGGAQCAGPTAADDVLLVFAEAFERDADPDDFSLEAILAHERGHQLLFRHKQLRRLTLGRLSVASEEVVASLLGSLLVESTADREALVLKAIGELLSHQMNGEAALRLTTELRSQLEQLL